MARIAVVLGTGLALAIAACGSKCDTPSGNYVLTSPGTPSEAGGCAAWKLTVGGDGGCTLNIADLDASCQGTTIVNCPTGNWSGQIKWSNDASTGSGTMLGQICDASSNCCNDLSDSVTITRN